MKLQNNPSAAAIVLLGLAHAALVLAQDQAALQARVEAVKGSFAESQARLRGYQWIETTIIAVRGEEKSSQQKSCYYGADGALQKVTVDQTAAQTPRGLRGRIAEAKKEEMTDYMQQAVATIQQYVPPDSGRIQAAAAAGKVSIHMTVPGQQARLEFRDYLKPGDSLALDLELTANRILGARIATYVEGPEDPVTLEVSFDLLQDGTIYARQTTLDAPAQELQVTSQNTGYRPL
jgi:hypothetical protein